MNLSEQISVGLKAILLIIVIILAAIPIEFGPFTILMLGGNKVLQMFIWPYGWFLLLTITKFVLVVNLLNQKFATSIPYQLLIKLINILIKVRGFESWYHATEQAVVNDHKKEANQRFLLYGAIPFFPVTQICILIAAKHRYFDGFFITLLAGMVKILIALITTESAKFIGQIIYKAWF